MNRNITIDWHWLPLEYQGLGFPNMRIKKASVTIGYVVRHWDMQDNMSLYLWANVSSYIHSRRWSLCRALYHWQYWLWANQFQFSQSCHGNISPRLLFLGLQRSLSFSRHEQCITRLMSLSKNKCISVDMMISLLSISLNVLMRTHRLCFSSPNLPW